jgi:hypothetical protein
VILALVGVGVLVPLALAVPFTRAWILALSIAAVAWVVLLPRGWFSQSDHPTRQILTVFLFARVVMLVLFELFGQGVGNFTGGGSDSRAYTGLGEVISDQINLQGYSRSHRETPGTGNIDLAVGYFFWLGAPVRNAANFLWASAATIGLLLFWTSTKHLAAQRLHLYTAAVLMLPTLLFWNSGVGKEAPLILGTAAMVAGIFYVAEQGRVPIGIAYFTFGAVITGLVRPHITFLIIVSAAVGVTLASRRAASVSLGRRVVTLGIVGIAMVAVIPVTLQLIDPTGTRSFIDAANTRADFNVEFYQPGVSAAGGSTFATSTVRSPLDVPRAVVTVLFRPFPWEVRSPTQALAALEAAVIGIASVAAGWSVLTGRAKFNRTPLTLTALTYTLVFSIAFVSLGNFGLLVRQRMQVVGFLLVVLFSVYTVTRDFRSTSDEGNTEEIESAKPPRTA